MVSWHSSQPVRKFHVRVFFAWHRSFEEEEREEESEEKKNIVKLAKDEFELRGMHY